MNILEEGKVQELERSELEPLKVSEQVVEQFAASLMRSLPSPIEEFERALGTDSLRVTMFGLGYIGLPTAALIASRNIPVTGVDVNPKVVEMVNQGQAHFSEPDLDRLVASTVQKGLLKASLRPEAADVFLIAVPTPFKAGNEPDLIYIEAVASVLAPLLKKGNLVILESTSPVGTTEQLAAWLSEARLDLTFPHTHGEASDIRLTYCPERVLPGNVLFELTENTRIIGGMTKYR